MNSLTHYLENISDDLNPAVRNFRHPKDVLAQLIYTSKFISDIFMLHATNSLIHYLENISDDFNSAVRNFRRPKYAQYSKTSVAPKPLVFFMERILLEILLKSTVNCIISQDPTGVVSVKYKFTFCRCIFTSSLFQQKLSQMR